LPTRERSIFSIARARCCPLQLGRKLLHSPLDRSARSNTQPRFHVPVLQPCFHVPVLAVIAADLGTKRQLVVVSARPLLCLGPLSLLAAPAAM
jgi:hypothetical protein